MRIAALAAESERNGEYGVANILWRDSTKYPCNEVNSVWRYHRANYCEQRAHRATFGVMVINESSVTDPKKLKERV